MLVMKEYPSQDPEDESGAWRRGWAHGCTELLDPELFMGSPNEVAEWAANWGSLWSSFLEGAKAGHASARSDYEKEHGILPSPCTEGPKMQNVEVIHWARDRVPPMTRETAKRPI